MLMGGYQEFEFDDEDEQESSTQIPKRVAEREGSLEEVGDEWVRQDIAVLGDGREVVGGGGVVEGDLDEPDKIPKKVVEREGSLEEADDEWVRPWTSRGEGGRGERSRGRGEAEEEEGREISEPFLGFFFFFFFFFHFCPLFFPYVAAHVADALIRQLT